MSDDSRVLSSPAGDTWEQEPVSVSESMVESETLLNPAEVASLAYGYWLERGCPCDSTQEDKDADWFRAESELRAQSAAPAKRPPAQAELRDDARAIAVGE